jgi:hypothetical protein
MIITKAHAQRLIKAGKARTIAGDIATHDGKRYQIVDRLDLQRVDHYEVD